MTAASFEWDAKKDVANQAEHGVPFAQAQFAFADRLRVIARDLDHSATEDRSYCFGRVEASVLTVRFTYRGGASASSAPASGAREKLSMSKKIAYTNEPLGGIEVIPDFLPPPAELAFREDGVKVTLALSRKSVEFFKAEAFKHSTQYQRMIRRLLDAYVDVHAEREATGLPKRTQRKRASL